MQTSTAQVENLPAEEARWETLVKDILQLSKKEGASNAEVSVSKGVGFSVTVRMGSVETLEHNRDKGVGLTVYFGQRKGSASTTDISPESIKATVAAACSMAKLAGEDPFSGLASADLMAKKYPNLDLYHPWEIDTEQAIVLAEDCENIARAVDKRITNSDGATISTYQGLGIYGNTNGFIGGCASTRHSISCAVVAQDSKGMQRDGYYTVARDYSDLESISTVAKETGKRAVQRLGSRRLKTCTAPVIFTAEVARGLLGSFLSAISGGNLYRKSTFLLDHLGQPIFAPHIHIDEKPHILKALASAPFDAEGVKTCDRTLINAGVLEGYLLSSYSARKLGLQSTGNAGGAHNIIVNHSELDFDALVKKMQKGLIVTELLGQGVNLVTGDYSRGAVGFWVENGEIQYPVEEVTIAGNLRDMFLNIVAISNDVDRRGTIQTGSILLEKMMIAGE